MATLDSKTPSGPLAQINCGGRFDSRTTSGVEYDVDCPRNARGVAQMVAPVFLSRA